MANDLTKKPETFKMTEKHWRINTLVFFILAIAAVIALRLYVLQVKSYEKYVALAQNQHRGFEKLLPERGEIFLSDEKEPYPVAINQRLNMAYAVAGEIIDKRGTAESLAEILSLDKKALIKKFENDKDRFEILKRRLSEVETEKIRSGKFAGIYLLPESFRYYPGGELASQTIGFVGSDGEIFKGRYGIESYWEEELKGESGSLSQERDTRGRWISITDRELSPVRNGVSLILTLNHTIQYEVEKILQETVEKHRADSGVIIAMEVKSGKLLAMAGFPDFNPNEYGKTKDISVFNNSAVSVPYECGSVFKPITAAIAIDDGKINPETEYVDTGKIKAAGFTIKNSEEKTYGRQTMIQVLEKSINTGAIFMQKQVGNVKFRQYVENFGFGAKTGIELPSESPGSLKNLKEAKRDINFFTASFGQGITVTPLQLVNAYAAIGNDGKLMKPQIVAKKKMSDGVVEEISAQEVRQVISPETARKVRKMLLNVVINGHGKKAAVSGYLVGGKTGTAQVAKIGSQGYEEGLTIGSFVGLAPIDEPQFAILVKISNPKDIQWAESTAAPAFAKVAKLLLEYHGVKPTEK